MAVDERSFLRRDEDAATSQRPAADATGIEAILNPGSAGGGVEAKDGGSGSCPRRLHRERVQEIEVGFATLRQQLVGTMIVDADPCCLGRRPQIVALAERYPFPAVLTNSRDIKRRLEQDGWTLDRIS